ncbi:hypothetical protein [Parvularcula sp. LCG005]|uniref:hypothetical protein n=1 Tax=Parvularcula sp. LCG005 TaxID=3078805 RepID=UPI0029420ECB|nr:hypothetical protein [Parvularcula sp. LCG005]WOI54725.1 hypothetical protein RUI03_06900 [Parvularcula sp. LCG005]
MGQNNILPTLSRAYRGLAPLTQKGRQVVRPRRGQKVAKQPPAYNAPLFASAMLFAAGIALRQWKPAALDLPKLPEQINLDKGKSRHMRQARDSIAKFLLPRNLSGSISNSLIMLGGGVLLLRLLDEIVDDDERLF